jgi:hypothetical protein
MKQIRLIMLSAFTLFLLTVNAADGVTVTVNGVQIEKALAQLTFDADNVIMHFGDSTTQTADMSDVNITILAATGIRDVYTTHEVFTDHITIGGVGEGESVAVFDMKGMPVVKRTVAHSTSVSVDISKLSHGIYILQIGHKAIKFQKK